MEQRSAVDPGFRDWITKQAARGAEGFKLFVREGMAWAPLDTYQAAANVEGDIWRDAQSNADGFTDLISVFTVKAIAVGDAGETVLGSRVISLRRADGGHAVDQFDPGQAGLVRLMMEHMDKQSRVITQVLPAVTLASTQALGAMAAHLSALGDSHAEAIRVLKEDKAATLQAEHAGMDMVARHERLDKVLDQVMQVLPLLLAPGESAPS